MSARTTTNLPPFPLGVESGLQHAPASTEAFNKSAIIADLYFRLAEEIPGLTIPAFFDAIEKGEHLKTWTSTVSLCLEGDNIVIREKLD